jgi:glycosyltransferase involved in cell wall biosynthesis
MRISILVPTYNRRDMVDEAIELILKNDDISVHEIIISENHGNDGSYEFLKEKYGLNSKVVVTKPSQKGGAVTNWKHCLHLATGTHVHWHWSDDYLAGAMYSKAKVLNEQHGSQVILFGASIVEDGKTVSGFHQVEGNISMEDALLKLFSFNIPVSPAAYILPIKSVRKHFYTDIPQYGAYNPMSIAMGSDALMIAGAIFDHHGLRIVSDNIINFRSHEESITVQNVEQLLNYRISFLHFLKTNTINRPSKLAIRKIFGNKIVDDLWRGNLFDELQLLASIAQNNGVRAVVKRLRDRK